MIVSPSVVCGPGERGGPRPSISPGRSHRPTQAYEATCLAGGIKGFGILKSGHWESDDLAQRQRAYFEPDGGAQAKYHCLTGQGIPSMFAETALAQAIRDRVRHKPASFKALWNAEFVEGLAKAQSDKIRCRPLRERETYQSGAVSFGLGSSLSGRKVRKPMN